MATLDPGSIVMTFKGVNITGVMDGTFCEVERAEDAVTMHVGAQGEVTRVMSRNKTGSVTFNIVQSSVTNQLLSAIAAADEKDRSGVGPLLITDLNGTTVYKATEAWIRKLPKGEHAKDATGRSWVIDCAKLLMNVGGSLT